VEPWDLLRNDPEIRELVRLTAIKAGAKTGIMESWKNRLGMTGPLLLSSCAQGDAATIPVLHI